MDPTGPCILNQRWKCLGCE
ncbi:hypothetical protein RDI58_029352 [Solanum bulbocastanum]|uniref:Uncharacterized protein n=1 Tax=Solanum bulbocastanum TaxID=147425 RepID=A0AAN8SXB7_SOLBU